MKKMTINFGPGTDTKRPGRRARSNALALPGKVTAVSSRLSAVDVRLENGTTIRKAVVLSRQWVTDGGDAVTGRRDLPPVGSYVLVFFPEGPDRPDSAYVMGSMFMPISAVPHTPFIDEGTEGEEFERSPAGWTETINRETGRIDIQHDGGIVVTVDPETGLTVTDQHGNTVTTADSGVDIEDSNGNTMVMDNNGITIEDKNGNQVVLSSLGVKLKTGDATSWMPNTVPACLFTGAPHGGPGAGITKLKGG